MVIKSTITLRLDDEEQTAVAGLQAFTGQRTASKAILTAVRRYPDELRRAHELEDELREARSTIQEALEEIVRLKLHMYGLEAVIQEFTDKAQSHLPANLDGFEQG